MPVNSYKYDNGWKYIVLILKELAKKNHSSIEEELKEAVETYYNWFKFQTIPIHFEWIGRGQYFTILVPPELTSTIMEVCAEENLHSNELVLNVLKEYTGSPKGWR